VSFFKAERAIYLKGPEIYLPEQVVTNDELVEKMGVKARGSWIEKKSGIRERRWASDSEACSDLACQAGEKLLAKYTAERERIRLLVLATISGDYPTPPTAPLVQDRLRLKNCGAFDLGAACAGFVTGLHAASSLQLATRDSVLLIASDIRSKFLDLGDFATASLFGDGAAACILSSDPSGARFKLLASAIYSEGSVADLISIQAGGSRLPHSKNSDPSAQFMRMQNNVALFLTAAEGMAESAKLFLAKLGMSTEGIDWVVPHQANLHLIEEVAKRIPVPSERWVKTVQYTGNTSGSSVGIALHSLAAKDEAKPGQKVLLVSAGGGGLAACALLEIAG
jgi:3-oxoacyl-[acyl-carrier-protein] synthase-3